MIGQSTSRSTGTGTTTVVPAGPVGGPLPAPPGYARHTRLALDPRIRQKLERLEARAAAAYAEVLRLGDLLEGERRHDQELAATVRFWGGGTTSTTSRRR